MTRCLDAVPGQVVVGGDGLVGGVAALHAQEPGLVLPGIKAKYRRNIFCTVKTKEYVGIKVKNTVLENRRNFLHCLALEQLFPLFF